MMRKRGWSVNLVMSAIFLCSVLVLADINGWTYINMPLIQVPTIIGFFWFFYSFTIILSYIGDFRRDY